MERLPEGEGLEAADLMGRVFVSFNKSWTQAQRTAMRDALRFGDEGEQAMLFPDHVEIFGAGDTKKLDLGGVAAMRFQRDLPCGDAGEGQLVLQDANKRLYSLSLSGGTPVPLDCAWPKGALDYARLDKDALVLLEDGTVPRLNGDKTEPVGEFLGRKFTRMLRLKEPIFWEMVLN